MCFRLQTPRRLHHHNSLKLPRWSLLLYLSMLSAIHLRRLPAPGHLCLVMAPAKAVETHCRLVVPLMTWLWRTSAGMRRRASRRILGKLLRQLGPPRARRWWPWERKSFCLRWLWFAHEGPFDTSARFSWSRWKAQAILSGEHSQPSTRLPNFPRRNIQLTHWRPTSIRYVDFQQLKKYLSTSSIFFFRKKLLHFLFHMIIVRNCQQSQEHF